MSWHHQSNRFLLGFGQTEYARHLVSVKISVVTGTKHKDAEQLRSFNQQQGRKPGIPNLWSVGARFKSTGLILGDFF